MATAIGSGNGKSGYRKATRGPCESRNEKRGWSQPTYLVLQTRMAGDLHATTDTLVYRLSLPRGNVSIFAWNGHSLCAGVLCLDRRSLQCSSFYLAIGILADASPRDE
ncbi:hypothetical protein VNO77_34380 [Canavalia gladiata]|uniref:Uncharacterized protein n=1 Tax=Canavalia gladiata TaxID=3824 RepID=A0AAN9KGM1_CANGL